jgi:D-3-phosphoglycerate dehydrogenase / 2-oxoglutarate reductase
VREDALIDALTSKAIAGAALDVYEAEPLPADHPLRSLDNVVLTPHLGASTSEAQRNVAVEIAEAVRDALLHDDLSRAVNAPAIGGEDLRRLRPLLGLAERLGLLCCSLIEGGVSTIEVKYSGSAENALRVLTASVLVGMLGRAVGPKTVNLVNALHLARDRGIQVQQVRQSPQRPFGEQLEVRATSGSRATRVAGALLGDAHRRIVRIDDFHVDVVPSGTMLVIRNNDVPGVIGHVGTLLGQAGVNIAEYHQARLGAPGGEALAAIAVDGRVSADVLTALRALGDIRRVDQVVFDRES